MERQPNCLTALLDESLTRGVIAESDSEVAFIMLDFALLSLGINDRIEITETQFMQ